MKRVITVVTSLVLVPLAAGASLAVGGSQAAPPAKVVVAPKATKIQASEGTKGGGNEVVAYRMKVVTKWGEEFTGVVKRTKAFDDAFANAAKQPGSKFDPQEFVELRWFNGLNGSVSFRMRDIATIERLDGLTNDNIAQIETKQAGDRVKRLEKEQVRLSIVFEQRAARKQAEAEVAAKTAAAKTAQAVADIESPPQYKAWLDRFPPEKGWIPAKKSQLYYNQVVLGTGALSVDEKDWIDHYEEWKEAYDWWAAEQKALTGTEPPAGTDNPNHATSAIDGDNALKLRELPPAIDYGDKTPPIPTGAPGKPVPLDPDVTPPIKTDGKN